MSLDVTISGGNGEYFSANITHNLNKMAGAAGISEHVWRPEEIGITKAAQLIWPLEEAITDMALHSDKYKQFDSPNGWGTYKNFLPWLAEYLSACKANPDGDISVDR